MNALRRVVLALALGLNPPAAADAPEGVPEELQDVCRLRDTRPLILSNVSAQPSYFAKIHPEGSHAFYIGSGNRMLTLESNDMLTRDRPIVGSIDPVPSPDGRILAVPGLEIYWLPEVMEKGEGAELLLEDADHSGVYQSVALLRSGRRGGAADLRVYRVITDSSGEVLYRDYEVNFSGARPTARILGNAGPGHLCPGKDYKTIMISKTGRLLGAYDPTSGTSKVIDVAVPGRCREVLDLGYPTGKIEFRHDDGAIAFHVDYYDTQAGGYFSGVSSTLTKDVYVVELQKLEGAAPGAWRLHPSKVRRIFASSVKGSGGYYPSWTRDGRLVYVRDDHNHYAFEVVRPEDAPSYRFLLPPHGGTDHQPEELPKDWPKDWNEQLHRSAALGGLWSQLCSPYDAEQSAVGAMTAFLSLEAEVCRKLARSHWTPDSRLKLSEQPRYRRDPRFDPAILARLEPEELESACREDGPPPTHETKVYGQRISQNLDGPGVIHHYCVGCHVTGGNLDIGGGSLMRNPVDFSNLTQAQVMESLDRMDLWEDDQGRMPPQGFDPPIETDEGEWVDHQELATDYLNEVLAELQRDPPLPDFPGGPAR
ncbi:MAG: hypothetical protein IT285_12300 [Bdellovibrionales bacterium]|nr:hypothetical protein [Bdellovibrionales bacterium]